MLISLHDKLGIASGGNNDHSPEEMVPAPRTLHARFHDVRLVALTPGLLTVRLGFSSSRKGREAIGIIR